MHKGMGTYRTSKIALKPGSRGDEFSTVLEFRSESITTQLVL